MDNELGVLEWNRVISEINDELIFGTIQANLQFSFEETKENQSNSNATNKFEKSPYLKLFGKDSGAMEYENSIQNQEIVGIIFDTPENQHSMLKAN